MIICSVKFGMLWSKLPNPIIQGWMTFLPLMHIPLSILFHAFLHCFLLTFVSCPPSEWDSHILLLQFVAFLMNNFTLNPQTEDNFCQYTFCFSHEFLAFILRRVCDFSKGLWLQNCWNPLFERIRVCLHLSHSIICLPFWSIVIFHLLSNFKSLILMCLLFTKVAYA